MGTNELKRSVELEASPRQVLDLWAVLREHERLDGVEQIIVLRDDNNDPAGATTTSAGPVPSGRLTGDGGPPLGRSIAGGTVELTELATDRTRLTVNLRLTATPETTPAVTRRLAEMRLEDGLRRLVASTGELGEDHRGEQTRRGPTETARR